MTQAERILYHIDTYGSITAFEAVTEYGILQLAARMCELNRKGYFFDKEVINGTNRYGEPVRYIRYRRAK